MKLPRLIDAVVILYGLLVVFLLTLRLTPDSCIVLDPITGFMLVPFFLYGGFLKTAKPALEKAFFFCIILLGLMAFLFVLSAMSSIPFAPNDFLSAGRMALFQSVAYDYRPVVTLKWSELACSGGLVLKNRLPRTISAEQLHAEISLYAANVNDQVGRITFFCEDERICYQKIEVSPLGVTIKAPVNAYLSVCKLEAKTDFLLAIDSDKARAEQTCERYRQS